MERLKAAAGVYATTLALALTGIFLSRHGDGIATLWLANAVLIAALVTAQLRRWPPLIAAFMSANVSANLLVGDPLWIATGFALVNASDGLLAALLIRSWTGGMTHFDRVGHIVRFTLAAGICSPLLAAVLGSAFTGWAFGEPYVHSFRIWFAGDAIGNIALAPLLILLRQKSARQTLRERRRRELWPILVVIAAAMLVFGQSRLPIAFLLFPAALIATMRLGSVGAALSLAIIGALGGAATAVDQGTMTLAGPDINARVGVLHLLVVAVFLVTLPVAAVLAERRRLVERLTQSEQRHRELFESVADIVYTTDERGRFMSLNPAWSHASGERISESLGRSFLSYIHPDDREAMLARLRSTVIAGESDRPVIRCLTSRGVRSMSILVQPVFNGQGELLGTRGTMRDVTERVALEAQLRELAETDALTGLPNRRVFLQVLDAEIARASVAKTPLSLAVLDVDHFKRVNDVLGHAVGDDTLKVIALRLREALRDSDLCARLGGEEFVVLMPGQGHREASLIGERLCQAVASGSGGFHHGQTIPAVTISVGVAEWRPDEAADRLLVRADRALYQAKENGRNRVALAA